MAQATHTAIDPGALRLVETVKERCRLCYTCVRDCPAKAIRVAGGEAAVIDARCIACGRCVQVCRQRAKRFRRDGEAVLARIAAGGEVVACLAASFPAEFPDVPAERVVGMLRRLGFSAVHEVAFGADLVARRYQALLAEADGRRWIASTCPAIVSYVERYLPDLVPSLAPVVSPIIALARHLRRTRGPQVQVVFIGACLARKAEVASAELAGDVAAVLTFIELRELLEARGIGPESVEPSDFDPPRGRGSLFPQRGLLGADQVGQGLASGDVVAADGRTGVFEAIDAFERGELGAKLLEPLACPGCIMGPGVSVPAPYYSRQAAVARHVRERRVGFDERAWQVALDRSADLDLRRAFAPFDQRLAAPSAPELAEIMGRLGKPAEADELDCGACGYHTCRGLGRAIHSGLAQPEMCLPYTIEHLRRTHEQLSSAQEALVHAEKLASLGQLAAGVAHEVNNPLGVVLLYAHLLLDDTAPNSSTYRDLQVITEQAERCRRIVARLLDFARQNKANLKPVDVHELVEGTAGALPRPAGVTLRTVREGEPVAEVDEDQLAQVVTNLVCNAFDAMPDGGTLSVTIGGDAERVRLVVADTGTGIPPANLGRIFEPFFTTKPMGRGTGLGLAVTYGIVKMHRGEIRVESNADPDRGPTGSTFAVTLPRRSPQA